MFMMYKISHVVIICNLTHLYLCRAYSAQSGEQFICAAFGIIMNLLAPNLNLDQVSACVPRSNSR